MVTPEEKLRIENRDKLIKDSPVKILGLENGKIVDMDSFIKTLQNINSLKDKTAKSQATEALILALIKFKDSNNSDLHLHGLTKDDINTVFSEFSKNPQLANAVQFLHLEGNEKEVISGLLNAGDEGLNLNFFKNLEGVTFYDGAITSLGRNKLSSNPHLNIRWADPEHKINFPNNHYTTRPDSKTGLKPNQNNPRPLEEQTKRVKFTDDPPKAETLPLSDLMNKFYISLLSRGMIIESNDGNSEKFIVNPLYRVDSNKYGERADKDIEILSTIKRRFKYNQETKELIELANALLVVHNLNTQVVMPEIVKNKAKELITYFDSVDFFNKNYDSENPEKPVEMIDNATRVILRGVFGINDLTEERYQPGGQFFEMAKYALIQEINQQKNLAVASQLTPDLIEGSSSLGYMRLAESVQRNAATVDNDGGGHCGVYAIIQALRAEFINKEIPTTWHPDIKKLVQGKFELKENHALMFRKAYVQHLLNKQNDNHIDADADIDADALSALIGTKWLEDSDLGHISEWLGIKINVVSTIQQPTTSKAQPIENDISSVFKPSGKVNAYIGILNKGLSRVTSQGAVYTDGYHYVAIIPASLTLTDSNVLQSKKLEIDEEDILLKKVASNTVGAADALLPRGTEEEKLVLLEGLNGASELETLIALVISDKIKFDQSRSVYTNENDLSQSPQSQLGQPYEMLMKNAVKRGVFQINDGKVSLSAKSKGALLEMQKQRDSEQTVLHAKQSNPPSTTLKAPPGMGRDGEEEERLPSTTNKSPEPPYSKAENEEAILGLANKLLENEFEELVVNYTDISVKLENLFSKTNSASTKAAILSVLDAIKANDNDFKPDYAKQLTAEARGLVLSDTTPLPPPFPNKLPISGLPAKYLTMLDTKAESEIKAQMELDGFKDAKPDIFELTGESLKTKLTELKQLQSTSPHSGQPNDHDSANEEDFGGDLSNTYLNLQAPLKTQADKPNPPERPAFLQKPLNLTVKHASGVIEITKNNGQTKITKVASVEPDGSFGAMVELSKNPENAAQQLYAVLTAYGEVPDGEFTGNNLHSLVGAELDRMIKEKEITWEKLTNIKQQLQVTSPAVSDLPTLSRQKTLTSAVPPHPGFERTTHAGATFGQNHHTSSTPKHMQNPNLYSHPNFLASPSNTFDTAKLMQAINTKIRKDWPNEYKKQRFDKAGVPTPNRSSNHVNANVENFNLIETKQYTFGKKEQAVEDITLKANTKECNLSVETQNVEKIIHAIISFSEPVSQALDDAKKRMKPLPVEIHGFNADDTIRILNGVKAEMEKLNVTIKISVKEIKDPNFCNNPQQEKEMKRLISLINNNNPAKKAGVNFGNPQ